MKSLLDRLEDKILIGDGCWEWTAARDHDGYGILTSCPETRSSKAHRIVYELMVEPIPDGLQIDHLCRNRGCVRPDHLEVVDCRTNLLRGNTLQAKNAAMTHCIRGHEFIQGTKQRRCRICERDRTRVLRAKKKGL